MANHMDGERSAGEIVQDVLRDVGNIVRGEIRLAGAEMREKAVKAGKAGGLFAGAAVCGLFAVACFVTTCIAALALAMPLWLAALLMCVFLACAGGAFYAGARSRLKRVDPVPQRTVQTAKETVQWAKQRTT